MNKKSGIKTWTTMHAGWLLIGLFCALPLLRWFQIHPFSEAFSSTTTTFGMLGKVGGLTGLVLYAINLVLATRARWLENLFGGLNRVYIAHHITGGIALILVAFHPFFLALKYIDFQALDSLKYAAKFLLPRGFDESGYFYEVQQAFAINTGIVAFQGMVVLLLLTFFVKLPYRIWLFTHKFLGVAFMFAGLHVILISSDTSKDFFIKYYMLLWIIAGLVAFVYRTLMNNVFVRKYAYRVSAVSHEEGNVVGIALEPLEKPLHFKPGQFVFIRFMFAHNEGIATEYHPFSIASAPNEKGLRLYIKSLGDHTASLKNLKIGTDAEIDGAYGRFTYTNYGSAPQIWIGGGIGITPFLSMARSYSPTSPPVDLIYSVVSRSELIDQHALAEFLPAHYPNFRYLPYIFNEQDGFLTAEKIKNKCGGLEGKHIFICGPPPMMKALRAQFRKLGVPNSNIHTEEFTMN